MQRWDQVATGDATGPVFVPWYADLAGHLSQVEPDRLRADAGALTRALIAARTLLAVDACSLPLDLTLAAASLGCTVAYPPGWPAVAATVRPLASGAALPDPARLPGLGGLRVSLDAAARLQAGGARAPVLTAIPGPVTLYAQLHGRPPGDEIFAGGRAAELWNMACESVLSLARAWGEARIWAVAVVEDGAALAGCTHLLADEVTGVLEPVWNVLRYYQLRALLQVLGGAFAAGHGAGPLLDAVAAWAAAQPVDGVASPGFRVPPPLSGAGAESPPLPGVALDPALFQGTEEAVRPVLTGVARARCWVTTDGELPVSASLAKCQCVSRMLRGSPGARSL